MIRVFVVISIEYKIDENRNVVKVEKNGLYHIPVFAIGKNKKGH